MIQGSKANVYTRKCHDTLDVEMPKVIPPDIVIRSSLLGSCSLLCTIAAA